MQESKNENKIKNFAIAKYLCGLQVSMDNC